MPQTYVPPARVPHPLFANTTSQLKKYLDLPQKGAVMAEYVWIDGSNGIRSKSKVSIFHLFPSLAQVCGISTPVDLGQPILRIRAFPREGTVGCVSLCDTHLLVVQTATGVVSHVGVRV